MREDIDEAVELVFSHCLFDPVYMSEKFAKDRIRHALETLSDDEYHQIIKKLKASEE